MLIIEITQFTACLQSYKSHKLVKVVLITSLPNIQINFRHSVLIVKQSQLIN